MSSKEIFEKERQMKKTPKTKRNQIHISNIISDCNNKDQFIKLNDNMTELNINNWFNIIDKQKKKRQKKKTAFIIGEAYKRKAFNNKTIANTEKINSNYNKKEINKIEEINIKNKEKMALLNILTVFILSFVRYFIMLIIFWNMQRKKRKNHPNLINFFVLCLLFFSNNAIIIKPYLLSLNRNNIINIKINGRGEKHFLNENYTYTPSSISVNENEKLSWNDKYYNFTEDQNTITVEFNYPISSCENMFKELTNITEIKFLKFDKVKNMKNMFYNCFNLESINLENINTENVEHMEYMFYGCSKLKNINLINFNTVNVLSMNSMFENCNSLEELDLSNLIVSNVKNMSYMFHNCRNLKHLEIDNFNTKNVEDMSYMFSNCENLDLLDLSEFDTSSCHNFEGMFNGCSSLEYLDLSNFKTENATNMNYMFAGCQNLFFLNIINFDTSSVTKINNMFKDCESLIYLNIGEYEKNKQLLQKNTLEGNSKRINICFKDIEFNKDYAKYDFIFDCSKDCFKKNYNVNIKEKVCVENCRDNKYLKYQYKQVCMDKCPKGSHPSHLNEYLCEKNRDLRTNNNKSLKNKTNEYLLDIIDGIYKPFYRRLSSLNDSEGLDIDNDNNNDNVDDNANDNDNNNVDDNDNCNGCSTDQYLDYLHSKIETFNTNQIGNNFDFVHQQDGAKFTFTTTYNLKSNNHKDDSRIDLGICEEKIKQEKNLPNNIMLYILKIDIIVPGEKVQKVEYELYYPNEESKFTLIDLSICKDISIDIYIPLDISLEELEKYQQYEKNSNSNNDICNAYNNKNRLLSSQRKVADKGNSICEKGCELSNYDERKKEVKCSCSIKTQVSKISEAKSEKNRFVENVISIKNIINIKLLKCIHLLFDSKLIYKNIVNYLWISLFIFSIVSIFIFIQKNYKNIKVVIQKVYKKRKEKEDIIPETNKKGRRETLQKSNKKNLANHLRRNINIHNPNKKRKEKANEKEKKGKDKNIMIKNLQILNTNNDKSDENNKTPIAGKNTKKNDKEKIKLKKNEYKKFSKQKKKKKNQLHKSSTKEGKDEPSNIKIKLKNIGNNEALIPQIEIDQSKLIDSEINLLSYNKALKYDKRNYLEYYISLLRTNHILIFSFSNKDYNSTIIKIYIFFFTFFIEFSISTMFYSDSDINKIYEDEGTFDFIYQIPNMLYSSLISMLLINLIKMLGLFEDNMLNIKKCKFKKINETIKKETKKIKIKIILFYIITYILLFLLWLYVGCFCAVYQNAQGHLIKEVSSSFGMSLFTSLLICLLPGICRIPALKDSKKRPKCNKILYKISLIIQYLC